MAGQSQLVEMPLFPLATVLFPQGQLSLRIFEPRYLDLVRECTRHDKGFGVCLIGQDDKTGSPALPAAVGTVARIVDFHGDADGVLTILVGGGERFTVKRSRARHDGLLRSNVVLWADEPHQEVPVEFALLQSIAERLVEMIGPQWRHASRQDYEDASWLGFRLAELLPLGASEQQHLLELSDPLQRLAELRDILPRFQKP
ncbi:MAG: LON peptidase substrate-binding domain-containing protein [Rhodanobacter sp.]